MLNRFLLVNSGDPARRSPRQGGRAPEVLFGRPNGQAELRVPFQSSGASAMGTAMLCEVEEVVGIESPVPRSDQTPCGLIIEAIVFQTVNGVPFGGIFLANDDDTLDPIHRDEMGEAGSLLRLTTRAAVDLADLVSIYGDLDRTVRCCDRYLSGQLDDEARDAVFEAIVIGYARAFVTGRSTRGKGARRRVDDLVDALTVEQRRVHDQARELRDRHVGHRVSDDERAYVLAGFDSRGKYNGISILATRFASSPDLVDKVRSLAVFMRDVVEARIEAEQAILHEECTAGFASR